MAEQSESGARQGGVGTSTLRPLVLPEPYNGESDWSGWAEHFESVAAVNGWKELENSCGCVCVWSAEQRPH